MNYQNILLIDDDEDDQEIFLTAVGEISGSVNCQVYSDASEALTKLSLKKITPDVIFLDLNMPVMNGLQFLVAIKKNLDLKNIPIIIFSTSVHMATIELTKELGAMDYITKPDKYDTLVEILKTVIS